MQQCISSSQTPLRPLPFIAETRNREGGLGRERMGRLEKEQACIESPRTPDQKTTLVLQTHDGDMETEEFSGTWRLEINVMRTGKWQKARGLGDKVRECKDPEVMYLHVGWIPSPAGLSHVLLWVNSTWVRERISYSVKCLMTLGISFDPQTPPSVWWLHILPRCLLVFRGIKSLSPVLRGGKAKRGNGPRVLVILP